MNSRLARRRADHAVEHGLHLERPGDRPVVERDPAERAPHAARVAHPSREPIPPLVDRVAPFVVRGDHTRPATRDARLLEVLVHEHRELLEVRVDTLRAACRPRSSTSALSWSVRERLLAPRLAPEREPGPRTRRIAELADTELEEATRERVDRDRDDVPDLDRVDVRLHERARGLGEPLALPRSRRRASVARSMSAFSANGVFCSRPIRSVSVTTPRTCPVRSTTGT